MHINSCKTVRCEIENSKFDMSSNTLRDSWYKHPIIWNVVCIVAGLFVLGFLGLCFLDLWTHHGSTTTVPDIVGRPLSEAVSMLEDADLDYVISDSVYTKDKKPGSVVDVIPRYGSIVKAGREVYLTIVAYSAEPVIIDILLVDSSAKQAEAYLRSKGLKVQKQYVPYEFDDIVVGAKCRGRNLTVGSKVTIDDTIILQIGQIPHTEEEETDSLDLLIGASLDESTGGGEAETEVEPSFDFPDE